MSSYIPILAADCFFDSSGSPLSGTLTVTPSSKFRIGGGGQAIGDSISRTITGGSMVGTLQLADPSQTSPAGIGYTFTVTDKAYREETYLNVLIVADPVRGSFDLAQLNTGQFVTAVPQTVISISGAQSAGTATPEVFTTGSAPVSAYTMVAVQNGVAATASSGNLAQFGAVVGVAVAGAAAQSPLGVQTAGEITYNGWSWTPGLVFLGSNGVPTQIAPSSGFLQVVGIAVTSTSLLLSLQSPILIQ